MEKNEKELYLAPQSKEIKVAIAHCIALSGGIQPTGENDEIGWTI